MSKKILIYIEDFNNVDLAKKAQELADKMGDSEVTGIIIGEKPCGNSYFDKVYYVNSENLSNYSSEIYSKICIDFIKELQPEILLISATTQGRDLAPQIASALHTGLTADCTALDINEQGKLASTRPTFGGKLMATILTKTLPQMATVRPNVIQTDYDAKLKETEYIEIFPNTENIQQKLKLIEVIKKEAGNSVEDAKVLVVAGKGMKDNLDLVKDFAKKINGEFGVSRALVDLGLADASIQIGQTGKTVSPKLYIACGVSGAIQHTVGIMGAKKIIAINKDKDAPIFKLADVGIVGDAKEILQAYIEE